MSERRYAVLIAASQFPEEPKLLPLRAPENDVDGLNEVLASNELGGFTEIAVLKNEFSHVVHRKILRVLRNADKDDFVLIYYSGHGKLDLSGRLHLAAKDTTIDDLEATSICPMRIRESVENTHCNKVVLILDCCFSGAVGKIFSRGTLDEQLQLASAGRGTYIMTASTAIQIAQEKEDDQYGLFTKYLIEGIRTGAADMDEDGNVTVDELYRYVHNRMLDEGFQEPMKWDLNVRGELIVSRTGKSPREERRRAIRERLTDLFRQGSLPLRVLTEALALNDKQPPDDSDTQRRHLLDQLLLPEKLQIGDFIGAWYDASPRTSISAVKNRPLEPDVRARKTELQGPDIPEKKTGARHTTEEEAAALRKAAERAVPPVQITHEETTRLTAKPDRTRKIKGVALAAAIFLGIVLYAFFTRQTSTDLHIDSDPSGAQVSVGLEACQTPCALKLRPGSYQFEAKHDGYEPYSQTFVITPQTKSPLMLQLKPSPSTYSGTKSPSGAAAAQTLTPYPFPSDGFRASYPSEPKVSKQNLSTDAGIFELRSYVADPGDAALYIAVCDYGSKLDTGNSAEILQGAKDGALKNSKSHLVAGSEKSFTFQGNSAVEFQSETDSAHIHARFYMVGSTLYQTMVVSRPGNPYPNTQEFLDSFALITRTK